MPVTYLSMSNRFSRDKQFRIDVFQVPFERFAAEIFSQCFAAADITVVPFIVTYTLIIIFGVIIEPNLKF